MDVKILNKGELFMGRRRSEITGHELPVYEEIDWEKLFKDSKSFSEAEKRIIKNLFS